MAMPGTCDLKRKDGLGIGPVWLRHLWPVGGKQAQEGVAWVNLWQLLLSVCWSHSDTASPLSPSANGGE